MKIAYPVRIWKEDGSYLVQGLPPLDNVLTYGESVQEAMDHAREALDGVLGAVLDHGQSVPKPPPVGTAPEGVFWIEPSAGVAVPMLVRSIREDAGLNLGELANRLGVTYQAVQKWERSGANPTVATVDRILRALGHRLEISSQESGGGDTHFAIRE